jgi:hypothetical protein
MPALSLKTRLALLVRPMLAPALSTVSCGPIQHEIGIENGFGVAPLDGGTDANAGNDTGADMRTDCNPAGCTLELKWLYSVSGALSQLGKRVAIDLQGNLYFAGEYRGAAHFGDRMLDTGGARSNAFVTSLTPEGTPRWLLGIGSLNDQRLDAMAMSDAGPVVSVGYTNHFSTAGLEVPDGTNGALALLSFDLDGGGRWWKSLHNIDQSPLEPVTGPALLGLSDGNIVVAGNHNNSLTIDAQSLATPPEGRPFGFAMDLDAGRSVRWLKSTGNDQRWNAAASLSKGSVLVGEQTGPGGSDILLSWLDAAGDAVLSRRFGGAGEDAALSVVRGAGDVIYVSGYVSSALSLGGSTLAHAGLKDVFLASYGADGAHLWSRTLGSTSDDWGVAVRFAPDGHLVLVGMQGDAVDFGTGPVGAFANAVFVTTFDPQGMALSAQTIAMNNGQATDLAIAPDGSLYIAGYFDGALKLGGRTFTSDTGTDGFLMKLGAR